MNDERHLHLVLGGTGKTGRRVAHRLAARGLPVRVGSRTGAPRFDWAERGSWPAALRGVRAMYVAYHPDLAVPGAADDVGALVSEAVGAGVERIVLLSGRGEPGVLPAERAVQESGVAWTILRAAWFDQNFSEGFLADGIAAGELAFPAGSVAEPFVDADDIADVAVAALTGDAHAGSILELTGPRLLTFAEAVAIVGEAAGRPVRYTPVSSETYAAMMAPYLPPEQIAFFVGLFREVLDGHNAHLADGVERALGRAPRDFRAYARDAAAAGAWADLGVAELGAAEPRAVV